MSKNTYFTVDQLVQLAVLNRLAAELDCETTAIFLNDTERQRIQLSLAFHVRAAMFTSDEVKTDD